MKILHLEFGRYVYGGPIQVAYLMRGLSAFPEVENHLVLPVTSNLCDHIPNDCRARIHRIPIAGEADIRVYFRLRKIIRQVNPDVLHIHSRRGADLWGILAAKHGKVPCILTRRVDNADPGWLTRWRTRHASFVVGISRRICEVLREGGADPQKIRCVPDTVDTQMYRPGGDNALLSGILKTSGATRHIGIIAQLIERKGHRVLFKAIPEILAKHPKTVFLVFGKGPLEGELKREAAGEEWSDKVHFMGFRTDLDRLLPLLDLVVHPAFMEGMGVALLQSSACGVPVVASRAGGIPEAVEDGVSGFLVEPGDPAGLASKINEILGDPELHKRMSREGRKLTLERFPIERMAADYFDLYCKSHKIS